MSDITIPATEYADRLGIDAVPDWLPDLHASFLAIADDLDSTRDAAGYGPASVAHIRELVAWEDRPSAIVWALFRYLLGQPGTMDMFARDVVEEVRWAKMDGLWIAAMTPASVETTYLILGALEAVPAPDLPLTVDDVARLRKVVTDPESLERLDRLDAAIDAEPKPRDRLDPLFAERIAPALERPIGELLKYCALTRLGRPSWVWRESMGGMAIGVHVEIRAILTAIPAHLAEHDRFTSGEDVLRGLVFVAEAVGGDWAVPVLAEIVLAGGGTTPARSRKLANAAVEALYYRDEARDVVRELRERIPGGALRKRVDDVLRYM